jgi:hypothetical protein
VKRDDEINVGIDDGQAEVETEAVGDGEVDALLDDESVELGEIGEVDGVTDRDEVAAKGFIGCCQKKNKISVCGSLLTRSSAGPGSSRERRS